MLLKKLVQLDQVVWGFQMRPGLSTPLLILEGFHGYNVVYWLRALYAVEQGKAFDAYRASMHVSSESILDLCFYCVEEASRKRGSGQPLEIDTAYGFRICAHDGVYYAFNETAGTTQDTSASNPYTFKSLAELYAALQRLHRGCLEIYIHVGLPKTGSKFLQKSLFPKLGGLHFVDWQSDFFTKEFLKLKYGNPWLAIEDIRQAFEEYIAFVDETKIVISDESLTDLWDRGAGWFEKASALKRIFPSARIILTLREQADLLVSLYMQYLREGGFGSLAYFLRFHEGHIHADFIDYSSSRQMMVESLDFDRLTRLYEEIFGPDSVHVFRYEQLRDQPIAFLAQICAAMGVAVPEVSFDERHNRAYGRVGMVLSRLLNRFIVREEGNIGLWIDRPGYGFLSRVVNRFDQVLPIADRPLLQARINGYIRSVILALWRTSGHIELRRLIDSLDRLLYMPVTVLPDTVRTEIQTLFAASNRSLEMRLRRRYEAGGTRKEF